MTSINYKVNDSTQPGFENVKSGFEPTNFRFPDLPEQEAGSLTHPATLIGSGQVGCETVPFDFHHSSYSSNSGEMVKGHGSRLKSNMMINHCC